MVIKAGHAFPSFALVLKCLFLHNHFGFFLRGGGQAPSIHCHLADESRMNCFVFHSPIANNSPEQLTREGK